MDLEDSLHSTLKELLDKIGLDYSKIDIAEEEKGSFAINIQSENPSLLIGYRGDNIQAIQHLLKVITWRKNNNQDFKILVDIDDYRKRQEENVIALAERKVLLARKTKRPQALPPMSPYLRRKIHLHCMGAGFDDIETFSKGEDDHRHLVIKLKS